MTTISSIHSTLFAVIAAASLSHAALVDIPADTLQKWITVGTSFDFILIDIRDTSELTAVIATNTCRPYHLSWNQGVLRTEMRRIPKSAHVFLYCRSSSRSRSAGTMLVDSGYSSVYHLIGGMNGWGSRPTMSAAAVKPPSELPAASMPAAMTSMAFRNEARHEAPSGTFTQGTAPLRDDHAVWIFDLQGRRMLPMRNPHFLPGTVRAGTMVAYRKTTDRPSNVMAIFP